VPSFFRRAATAFVKPSPSGAAPENRTLIEEISYFSGAIQQNKTLAFLKIDAGLTRVVGKMH